MEHIILKLIDGTEIIGRIIETEKEYIKVDSPMRIVYRTSEEGIAAALYKYAFFVEQEVFEFNTSFVLQAMVPKSEFVEYYEDTLQDVTSKTEVSESNDTPLVDESGSTPALHDLYLAMIEKMKTSNTSIH